MASASADIVRKVDGQDAINTLYAEGPGKELCYVWGRDIGQDPQYWLLQHEGKDLKVAVLGMTGIVQSVFYAGSKGKKDYLLKRSNGYGNFRVKEGRSVEGVLNDVYEAIDGLHFRDNEKRELFRWRAQQVIARFGEMKELYGDEDIVPEYNDTMIVSKISENCPRSCTYCPEPDRRGMLLYDEETIRHNMEMSKKLHEKYHGKFIDLLDEGFLNTSDILWFHLAHMYANDASWRQGLEKDNPFMHNLLQRIRVGDNKGNSDSLDALVSGVSGRKLADPLEIVDAFHEYFPHVEKTYSFAGVPTINASSPEYLKELFNNAEGINRMLVGIESADRVTSDFLGKRETPEQKKEAIEKLQDAGFKVKAIVQVGMTGEGFYHLSKDRNRRLFRSSRTALANTAEWAESVMRGVDSRKPDKVLISRYTPLAGTPLARMHDKPDVIRQYSSSRGIEKDALWLLHRLESAGIDAELDYETAIQDQTSVVADVQPVGL